MENETNLFDLTGRVAIVTGSTKGIGRAIAYRLAQHGAQVVISSRKSDQCLSVARELNEALGRDATSAIAANISSKDALQTLVDETIVRYGRIDALVCNAATNPYYGPLSDISDEVFNKVLQNNILSNHWLTRMVAPQMRARKDGAIILISSTGGLHGTSVLGAYSITKAAEMQLARNLAVEFGADNVRVNTIAPGLIQTDFSRALWEDPAKMSQSNDGVPLGRIGRPDEIAGMAVLLASKAGAFVTGQTFVIDGGMTII
jgi:NAD(P)-dependent dehydrogenase (short-subunit alcohol dehydrogenase family)